MSVEMESNPENAPWPSESDFDLIMAEILTASPILNGESGGGINGEDTQLSLWSGNGSGLGFDLDFDFDFVEISTPPIDNNVPRDDWCNVGGGNLQRPPQEGGNDNLAEFLANFSASSAIFSGKPRGNRLPELSGVRGGLCNPSYWEDGF